MEPPSKPGALENRETNVHSKEVSGKKWHHLSLSKFCAGHRANGGCQHNDPSKVRLVRWNKIPQGKPWFATAGFR